MFVMGKFLLNLTPVINIIRFIHIKNFIPAWSLYYYYLGDAIVSYANDNIK